MRPAKLWPRGRTWRTQSCCPGRVAEESWPGWARLALQTGLLASLRHCPGTGLGPARGRTLITFSCPGLDLDESCAEAQDGELDGLWTTITIFITLFLLSVCYSATVTLFKVKWIFSSVVELKQTIAPDYRNMIGQGA